MARKGAVVHADELLGSLERFAATLTSGYGIGDVLHDLTEEITELLEMTGAGVTLVGEGRQRFVTAAISTIAELERVQENHQAGPCIDAVATARPVTVADLAGGDAGQRWPDYTIAAKAAGIHAVAGIPMLAEGKAFGAVNLYQDHARDWSAEDLRAAAIFANIATGYLVHASASRQHQRTAEQLQEALTTRIIIEQAKGVLATRLKVSTDEAFQLLRKYAREHGARIHEIARDVVNGTLQLAVQ
jgi:GAF domain-containing protein